MLRYLVRAPEIRALADTIPVREPGANGRPDAFPPIIHVIFQTLQYQYRSKRRAEANLSDPAAWAIIRDALAPLYPTYPCFQRPNAHRPNRHAYARFRNKHTACKETWEKLVREAQRQSCRQAEAMGMMDPNIGSHTRMAGVNVAAGDGTVISPRSSKTPTARQLADGRPVQFRHEPDALHFHTGTGERVLGTKWITVLVTNRFEDERIVLGIANQSHAIDGGEAAVALELIEALRSQLRGMQGIAWDMALRGRHIDRLYQLGLQTIVKVASGKGGGPKSRNIGRYTARLGSTEVGKVEVVAVGGAPGITVIVRGEQIWVRCTKAKVAFGSNKNGSERAYGTYRIPNHAPVPAHLRGAMFRIRYDNGGDTDPTLNRAEVLRPVVEDDTDYEDQWRDLYHLRPGTESWNKWLKDRLPNGLAPSYTVARQRFDLLGAQLCNNARAMIAHRRRQGLPDVSDTGPPDDLAAAA